MFGRFVIKAKWLVMETAILEAWKPRWEIMKDYDVVWNKHWDSSGTRFISVSL
jgi:hypothetical protein